MMKLIQRVSKYSTFFLILQHTLLQLIFLMVPFIAFFVRIYLPDYDSSFEVDDSARDTAGILGIVLFFFFTVQHQSNSDIRDHHSYIWDCSSDLVPDHNCRTLLWRNLLPM